MNAKVLSSLATALVVTSFVPPAIAETLGEHPAVVVARTWNNREIDPNTFIVAHPASTRWVSEAPKSADTLAHATEPGKLDWSAAIGTGYAARSTAKNSKVTSSGELFPPRTRIASLDRDHWHGNSGNRDLSRYCHQRTLVLRHEAGRRSRPLDLENRIGPPFRFGQPSDVFDRGQQPLKHVGANAADIPSGVPIAR
jgi:hypothetical protein